MEIILIVFTLLLIIFSILDIKTKSIPSILLTATIILLAFVKFENFQWAFIFGLFGYLLWEFSEAEEIEFGTADIKVMIMIGFFVPNVVIMLTLVGIFAVCQLFYIYLIKKYTDLEEVPFIPFFLGLWIGGLFGGIF